MSKIARVANPEAAARDRRLMQLIVERESVALAELYDRHSTLLLALARRVLSNAADAEEILQEVFLQVWNQAHRYEHSRSSVATWLVMLTRSRAIDRLRSRQSKERTAAAFEQETTRTHTSAKATSNVLQVERQERLQEHLAELPAEQRHVLELAFYRGLSQSEIAAQTGTPLGTVKTRTLLAMKKLRAALHQEVRELL